MNWVQRVKNLFVNTMNVPPVIENFHPRGLEREDKEELTAPTIDQLGLKLTVEIIDVPAEVWKELEKPTKVENKTAQPLVLSTDNVIREDVFGVTFAIEYEDSEGSNSTRRITLRHLYASGSIGYIRAYCHERKASRTFRFDRIVNVIDSDGVIYDAGVFFKEELKIDWSVYLNAEKVISSAAASSSATASKDALHVATPGRREKPGLAQRRAARDGLRVLTALARADGHLHEKEVAVLMAYLEDICEHQGICVEEADRAALLPYLKRQKPDEEVLERCLENIAASKPEQQAHFLDYAIRLADADGVVAEEEFQFLLDLRERIGRQSVS